MSTPILATKLYIPSPRPKAVLRSRLIAQLSEGLHRKLTLISAPAGFGKTTVVSAWIANCQRAVAWLSLDEGDSDPTRFLTYLVAALQTVMPEMGAGVLGLLQSPQPTRDSSAREAILTALINEIAAIPTQFVLVLDDYHVIDNSAIDQALTYLLDHLPPQMHLVITTREDPQIPLARLRVRDQLTELRIADLRFTEAEAAGFLNQVMDLHLAPEQIIALETRTEGWIAGLQLAALSMRGHKDVAGFVKAFAGDNRYIVDYLVTEVLQRQPAPVRNFLRQTAILDRLSGPLCDAVTGQDDAITLLDTLERGNLFVVPLDDTRHWFRYHHLFAEVLAAHTLQEQPAQVPLLHQRASAWYAANGWTAAAIRHALAGQDFARAAELIELAWPEMDGRFQTKTWLGWAQALPAALVCNRPVLCVAYGWALLNDGELEAADAWFGHAEQWLDSSGQLIAAPNGEHALGMIIVDEAQLRNLPASIATARAYQFQARGDISGSVKYGRRALDLLPATDYLRRGPAAALLGLAQWANGELEEAYGALADAMAGFQKAGNLHFALSVTSGLVDIRATQGRLREAVNINRQALHLALTQSEPLVRGVADLHLGLSDLYREQDHPDAIQHLVRSEELGEQAALPDWRYHLCRVQARFKQTAGNLVGALEQLDAAERYYYRGPIPDVHPLAAQRTRLWLAQGRLPEAQRWAREQKLSVDDELSFLRECDHITLVRVLLAEYAHAHLDRTLHDALSLLDRLQQAAVAGGRMGSVIEISVLQALAYQSQGNLPLTFMALERALRLAEPEGYIRLFVDEGLPLAQLLQAVVARGVMTDYVGKLLTTLGVLRRAQVSTSPIASAPQSLIEPLSPREVEVLQLIAQGLSNREIGAKLFLALSTVKGHNRLIFDKLQVERRTEAVARARALGLV